MGKTGFIQIYFGSCWRIKQLLESRFIGKIHIPLKNKVVLITGSASGIGRTTALLYADRGAQIVVSDINETGGEETVSQIRTAGGTAMFIKADVSKYEDVEQLLQKSVETFGRLDVAVNNAGIGAKRINRTVEHTIEDWDRVIAVNQTGVFYCMQLELRQMQKQSGGSIVNVASIAGLKGLPNNLAYAASKHAVVGMTKTAALEYARKNIRINAVCPVFTHSPLFQQLLDAKPDWEEKLKVGIPLRRYGRPEEVAEAIFWLSGEASGFITGHALPVDGGMMA